MKRYLLILAVILQSTLLFGQVPDNLRSPAVPSSGASFNNKAQIDANLKALYSLAIPRATSFRLNGAKDSIGYIMYNTTINRFGVYIGSGNWQTYLTAADLGNYALDANVVHRTGDENIAGKKTFTSDVVFNTGNSGNGASFLNGTPLHLYNSGNTTEYIIQNNVSADGTTGGISISNFTAGGDSNSILIRNSDIYDSAGLKFLKGNFTPADDANVVHLTGYSSQTIAGALGTGIHRATNGNGNFITNNGNTIEFNVNGNIGATISGNNGLIVNGVNNRFDNLQVATSPSQPTDVVRLQDLGGYVTLTGPEQTISSSKIFNNAVSFNSAVAFSNQALFQGTKFTFKYGSPLSFGNSTQTDYYDITNNNTGVNIHRYNGGIGTNGITIIDNNIVDENGKYFLKTGSVTPADSTSTTITTIPNLLTYTGPSKSVRVTDPLRGDEFNYIASGLTVDNGTVFARSGGGYWVRQYNPANGLNVTWYGADPTGTADASDIIESVIVDYAPNNTQKVFIPKGNFKVLSPIGDVGAGATRLITSKVEIYGEPGSRVYADPSVEIGSVFGFDMKGGDVYIHDLAIDANNKANRGAYFRQRYVLDTLAARSNLRAERITATNARINDGTAVETIGLGIIGYGYFNRVYLNNNTVNGVTTNSATIAVKGIDSDGSDSNGIPLDTKFENNTIENIYRDAVSSLDQDAIHVGASALNSAKNSYTVSGNVIRNVRGRGIKVQGTNGLVSNNLVFISPTFSMPAANGNSAIDAQYSDGKIFGNTVEMQNTDKNFWNSAVRFVKRVTDTSVNIVNISQNKLIAKGRVNEMFSLWENDAYFNSTINLNDNTAYVDTLTNFVHPFSGTTSPFTQTRNIVATGNTVSYMTGNFVNTNLPNVNVTLIGNTIRKGVATASNNASNNITLVNNIGISRTDGTNRITDGFGNQVLAAAFQGTSATTFAAGNDARLLYGDYRLTGAGTGMATNAVFTSDVLAITDNSWKRTTTAATNLPIAANGYVENWYRSSTAQTVRFKADNGREFSITKSTTYGPWREYAFIDNTSPIRTSTISAASTLTLAYTTDYSFSGTIATWTLPAVSSTLKGGSYQITIKNRGTGVLTINSAAGGNDIYTTVAINTYSLNPGAAITLINDGTYITLQ